MKHVSPGGLHELDDLLSAVRRLDGLTEKKRGVFYRRSRAFDATFERFRVTTKAERRRLVSLVRRSTRA